MNLIQYYWNIGSARFRHLATPGRYAFNGAVFTTTCRMRLDRRRPVIVHLDHPLMHVGDQLFFRPLVWRLKQAGFDISVTNRPSVDFLFEDVRRAEERPCPGSVVVLRHEALREAWRLYGPYADYFVIRQISREIHRPVANFILEAFAEWFKLAELDFSIDKTCFLPLSVRPDLVLKKFGLPETRPLIILSNYVDSGLHRKLPSRESAMLTQAARLKNGTGAAIIHVGTGRDRERDHRDYSKLVDYDLRARTSVEDLFHLLACANIGRVFCFDTAILHIAYVLSVPTTLFVKYYFSRAERLQKAAAFYSFFERPEVQAPQSM
jgi:hypothetical protein